MRLQYYCSFIAAPEKVWSEDRKRRRRVLVTEGTLRLSILKRLRKAAKQGDVVVLAPLAMQQYWGHNILLDLEGQPTYEEVYPILLRLKADGWVSMEVENTPEAFDLCYRDNQGGV